MQYACMHALHTPLSETNHRSKREEKNTKQKEMPSHQVNDLLNMCASSLPSFLLRAFLLKLHFNAFTLFLSIEMNATAAVDAIKLHFDIQPNYNRSIKCVIDHFALVRTLSILISS